MFLSPIPALSDFVASTSDHLAPSLECNNFCMIGQSGVTGDGGVGGWTGGLGHALSMVRAERVSAKGGMQVSVFNRLGLLFVLSAPLLLWCWWGCVIEFIKILGRQWQLPVEGWGVEGVEGASAIEGGSQLGCYWISYIMSPFISSREWWQWYSFSSCGDCRLPASSHVLSLSEYPFHLIKYCNRFCLPWHQWLLMASTSYCSSPPIMSSGSRE